MKSLTLVRVVLTGLLELTQLNVRFLHDLGADPESDWGGDCWARCQIHRGIRYALRHQFPIELL